jgi:O-antigen ligase
MTRDGLLVYPWMRACARILNREVPNMMPGLGFHTPTRIDKQAPEQVDLFALDNRIVILSVITAFINAYLCAAVALLTTVYVCVNREKRLRLMSVPHSRWIFLFFVLLFAVPLIYGNWIGLGAGLVIFVIFVYYLFLCTSMNIGLFNAVIDISCIISLIYVAVALFQRLLGVEPRSPSTFQNANYYSYALELVMMMSFYRLYTTRDWKHRAFIALVIAANLLALWSTDCRSAWPSIFAGLAVMFALGKKSKSLLVLIGVYIVGIRLALSFPEIFPRLKSLEFAEAIRTDIWLDALNCVRTHLLFGAGAMGFYFLTGGPYYHSHDLLLEMLVSFGLCGTFFLLTYFYATFRDMARKLRESPLKHVYTLIFACLAVTAVHGIADVTVMWPQTGMIFALILSGAGIKPVLPETPRLPQHE